MRRSVRGIGVLFGLLALVTLGCGLTSQESGPPRDAVVIEVMANSSLQPWLLEATAAFNGAALETTAGDPVYVSLTFLEAGQAVVDLAGGAPLPALWIPDDAVWASVLADQGVDSYQLDCVSLAQSPLVIAIWQPLAESLGWPGRDLGWLDIGSLAADPTAWGYYSGGQYGPSLRLGHTHPGLSASGASTLLAIVQAAQTKTDAVSVSDIEEPIVQASVGAFEGAVSWFSSDTEALGTTMEERGPDFLGAAVVYESTVAAHGTSVGGESIVPIYPFEGTFMATHPACRRTGLATDEAEAVELFRGYLLGAEAQTLAVSAGLRSVNAAVSAGPPLDASRGGGQDQPAQIFSPPSVETIYAVQDVWQSARKPVNLVMLLDVSGSMSGRKIESMVEAAMQFVGQMGDEDHLTLVTFSHELDVPIDHEQVGPSRERILGAIQGLEAGGDTALYDAIGLGSERIAQTTSTEATNALVVLTDGLDTYSYRYRFDDALIEAAAANDTTVFTIAYGSDADEALLSELSARAFGNFYRGTEASIAGIYEEMSAAFGGSLGVGR